MRHFGLPPSGSGFRIETGYDPDPASKHLKPAKIFLQSDSVFIPVFYFVDPAGPSLVRPQPVTEQSLMESVAGR